MTVSSRQGPDKLPDFPFYEWHNLFCSFAEPEAHLRFQTEAFKYKHFGVGTGIKNTKNLFFRFFFPPTQTERICNTGYENIIVGGEKVPFLNSCNYETWKRLMLHFVGWKEVKMLEASSCFPSVLRYERKLRKHSAFKREHWDFLLD